MNAETPEIPGYQVGEPIGEGTSSIVYRALRDGTAYAVKVTRGFDPSAQVALHFRSEAAAAARLNHPGVVRVYEAGEHRGRCYLVMQLVEGEPLDTRLRRGPLVEGDFLVLARSLGSALVEVHRHGLIHRDIKPANIIVRPDGIGTFIDFGFVTEGSSSVEDRKEAAGTLLYCPPEQSGVLKRGVDNRSDLYALGAVLFECLTGRPPYLGATVTELLQLQASAPVPDLRQINGMVRPGVAAIVTKLLAKDPDDRYQSAEGLIADLDNLAEIEDALRANRPYRLGARDVRARTAEKVPLVGRVHEAQALQETWRRTLESQGGLVLVEGEGGMGKTRLVRELSSFAQNTQAWILTGKCQQSDAVPFGPLREALDEVVARISRLDEGDRAAAVQRLRDAAGDFPGLLRRLSRGLEKLFADAPEPERSGSSSEDQELFYKRVADFLASLAKSGPVLIQIDDIQWVDTGTLEVLRWLAPVATESRLLVAATSRNDPQSKDALQRFIDEMGPALLHRTVLKPLTTPEVGELLAAHLGSLQLAPQFVEAVARRTDGNPFAVGEYVRAMLEIGALRPATDRWEVDEERFGSLMVSKDVFQLVLNRIGNLSPRCAQTLLVAAVVGNKFQAKVLASGLQWSEAEIDQGLSEAMRAHLIEPLEEEGGYEFIHDRLVESLLSGASAEQLKDVHQTVAEALDTGAAPSPELARALARHYVAGRAERNGPHIYRTSRIAGLYALGNYANQEAHDLLEQALQHGRAEGVPEAELQPVVEGLAEACSRIGLAEKARSLLDGLLARATQPVDIARLRSLIADALLHEGKPIECWRYSNEALKALGVPLPESKLLRWTTLFWTVMVATLLTATGWRFGSARGKRRERVQLMYHIYDTLAPISIVLGNLPLFLLLSFQRLLFAHRLGSGKEYAVAMGWIPYCVGQYGLVEAVHYFGKAAVAHGQQLGDRFAEWHARQHYIFGRGMLGAERDIPTAQENREAYPNMVKWTPPWELEGSALGVVLTSAMRGDSRGAVEFAEQHWRSSARERASKHDEGRRDRTRVFNALLLGAVQSSLHLLGRTQEAARCREQQLKTVGELGIVAWVQANVYYQEVMALVEQGEFGPKLVEAIEGFLQALYETRFEDIWMRFGYVVVAGAWLEVMDRSEGEARKKAERDLWRALHMAKSRTWTPVGLSYLHAVYAGAERARGRLEKAWKHTELAERWADQAQSAYAWFLLSRERARIARLRADLTGAAKHSARALEVANGQGWAKRAERLRQEFGLDAQSSAPTATRSLHESLAGRSLASSLGASLSGSFEQVTASRFADALLKVSLASASTIEPQAQTRAALDALVQVLAAERAFLFTMEESGKLSMALGRDSEGSDLQQLRGYSTTVVNKVAATQQPVIVTGTEEGEAIGSESAVAFDLRSIMAVPLMFRERLLGVVYLDSRLAKGLFGEEDVKVLLGIANHIAIAFESARAARVEVERREMEKDLALTAAVQSFFLPRASRHRSRGYLVEGYYRPAAQCSGDWWSFSERSGASEVLVGDVTGHGAASAMVTASVATAYRQGRSLLQDTPLRELLGKVSEELRTITGGDFQMTLCALELLEEGQVRYCAAAAPPILLTRAARPGFQELPLPPSAPLGASEVNFASTELQLEQGDRLVIFTDGLPELMLPNGRQLGIRRLTKIIAAAAPMPLDEAKEHIASELEKARRDTPLADDLTLVLVERVS